MTDGATHENVTSIILNPVIVAERATGVREGGLDFDPAATAVAGLNADVLALARLLRPQRPEGGGQTNYYVPITLTQIDEATVGRADYVQVPTEDAETIMNAAEQLKGHGYALGVRELLGTVASMQTQENAPGPELVRQPAVPTPYLYEQHSKQGGSSEPLFELVQTYTVSDGEGGPEQALDWAGSIYADAEVLIFTADHQASTKETGQGIIYVTKDGQRFDMAQAVAQRRAGEEPDYIPMELTAAPPVVFGESWKLLSGEPLSRAEVTAVLVVLGTPQRLADFEGPLPDRCVDTQRGRDNPFEWARRVIAGVKQESSGVITVTAEASSVAEPVAGEVAAPRERREQEGQLFEWGAVIDVLDDYLPEAIEFIRRRRDEVEYIGRKLLDSKLGQWFVQHREQILWTISPMSGAREVPYWRPFFRRFQSRWDSREQGSAFTRSQLYPLTALGANRLLVENGVYTGREIEKRVTPVVVSDDDRRIADLWFMREMGDGHGTVGDTLVLIEDEHLLDLVNDGYLVHLLPLFRAGDGGRMTPERAAARTKLAEFGWGMLDSMLAEDLTDGELRRLLRELGVAKVVKLASAGDWKPKDFHEKPDKDEGPDKRRWREERNNYYERHFFADSDAWSTHAETADAQEFYEAIGEFIARRFVRMRKEAMAWDARSQPLPQASAPPNPASPPGRRPSAPPGSPSVRVRPHAYDSSRGADSLAGPAVDRHPMTDIRPEPPARRARDVTGRPATKPAGAHGDVTEQTQSPLKIAQAKFIETARRDRWLEVLEGAPSDPNKMTREQIVARNQLTRALAELLAVAIERFPTDKQQAVFCQQTGLDAWLEFVPASGDARAHYKGRAGMNAEIIQRQITRHLLHPAAP